MLHRKKLLAVALAAAAGLPVIAAAQNSAVVLYGKLYPEFDWVHVSDATAAGTAVSTLSIAPTGAPSRNFAAVNGSNSRFGIRGTERLSSDLNAIFQIESKVPVDVGGGTLATRNTFVGLESAQWGTVRLGNMDTVYKQLGDNNGLLGVSSGNFVSNAEVLSKLPFGTSSAGSFHLRRGNSVQYDAPGFQGLKIRGQYSPDEAKTTSRNAYLISYGVSYATGPLYVAVAHEIHNDFFGVSKNAPSALSNASNLNAHSKDQAVRGTVKYKFGKTTLEADVARLDYKETGGAVGKIQDYKRMSYLVAVDHRMGNWRFGVNYTWAPDGDCSLVGVSCSTDGLSSSQLGIGAGYSLSKRTMLFALAARVNNDKSARANNLANGDIAPGADITQVALGISHSF